MNCHLCQNVVEGQPRTEQPCGCIAHTSCAYRYLSDEIWHHGHVLCRTCNVVIYQSPQIVYQAVQTQTAEERVNALLANAAFKKDLAAVKKSSTRSRKALTAFKKLIKEQNQIFQNLVQPLIQEIRARKQAACANIRIHDATREYRSANASSMALRTRFKNKYNLNRYELSKIKLQRGSYFRHTTSAHALRRAFRVRL